MDKGGQILKVFGRIWVYAQNNWFAGIGFTLQSQLKWCGLQSICHWPTVILQSYI